MPMAMAVPVLKHMQHAHAHSRLTGEERAGGRHPARPQRAISFLARNAVLPSCSGFGTPSWRRGGLFQIGDCLSPKPIGSCPSANSSMHLSVAMMPACLLLSLPTPLPAPRAAPAAPAGFFLGRA
eukprot:345027-Chlamydomonas_euryale.AAC.2